MKFKSVLEDLEIQLAVCEMTGKNATALELKMAIKLLQKENNVYVFPEVMSFANIERKPKPIPTNHNGIKQSQIYSAGGLTQVPQGPQTGTHITIPRGMPLASGSRTNIHTPKQRQHASQARQQQIAGQAIAPSSTGTNLGVNIQNMSTAPIVVTFSDYHEPPVGMEIFGLCKIDDGGYGTTHKCIYTWKGEDDPEEIYAYANNINPEFSEIGIRYMPCKKYQNKNFLVICTNDCCKQTGF